MSKESAANRGMGRWATALIAAGGLVIAWYLTELHVQAVVGESIGGALCDTDGVLDCASAMESHFSTLFGIPIALLGVSFYAAVLGLVLFDRESVRNGDDPFRPAAIASSTFTLGLGYSLFLAGVSAVELGSLCPFCTMLYVVNLVGLVASSVWAGKWPHRLILAQIKEPKSFFNGWTGLFAFGFAIFLFFGTSVTSTEIDNRSASAEPIATEELPRVEQERYRVDDAPAKGPVDAPVHIVEFSNFTCPFCARLAGVLHRINEDYPDQVRIEFRHFPLPGQEQGHLAARAAYCADEQGEFWPMHNQLFSGEQLDRSSIDEMANRAGLDLDGFGACVDSERAHERVDKDVSAGQGLGIRGTPTFFINEMQIGGVRPYDELVDLIEDLLEE